MAAAALPAQSRPPARDDRGSDRDVTVYRTDGADPLRIINGRMAADADRAVLGIGTGSGGDRDTLGLLVTTITPNGPAEKAGLEEGSRIAAINGVFGQATAEGAFEGFRAHTTEVEAALGSTVAALPRQPRDRRAGRPDPKVVPTWRDSLTTPRLEPDVVLREQEAHEGEVLVLT